MNDNITIVDYYDAPVGAEQREAALAWFERELEAGRLRTQVVKEADGTEHCFFYSYDMRQEEKRLCEKFGLNPSELRGHLERGEKLH